jgi:hypothetical protein
MAKVKTCVTCFELWYSAIPPMPLAAMSCMAAIAVRRSGRGHGTRLGWYGTTAYSESPCQGWRVRYSMLARARCSSHTGPSTRMLPCALAFAEIEADATVTRAEAMRRAMVALMDDGSEEDNAHPSVWAPFVLVGEGGR